MCYPFHGIAKDRLFEYYKMEIELASVHAFLYFVFIIIALFNIFIVKTLQQLTTIYQQIPWNWNNMTNGNPLCNHEASSTLMAPMTSRALH